MNLNNQSLHYVLINHFIEKKRAPSISELSLLYKKSSSEIRKALENLEAYHGCALSSKGEIAAVHPFSARATNFKVVSHNSEWWANCAWCAMGVIKLVGGTGELITRIFKDDFPTHIRVSGGEIGSTNFKVHFPVPMARIWENVVYSCSVMQVFRSEDEIDAWCLETGVSRGDVQPLSKVNRLAGIWYERHHSTDWEKWTTAEAVEIFHSMGFDHPVWSLENTSERF